MAAAAAAGSEGSSALSPGGEEPPAEAAAPPGPSAGFRLTAVRREPAVRLQHGVSGLEPLAWSEDHRVSVSTARSIAVLEQLSDIHSGGQELVIHRTAVPAPAGGCLLKNASKQASSMGYSWKQQTLDSTPAKKSWTRKSSWRIMRSRELGCLGTWVVRTSSRPWRV